MTQTFSDFLSHSRSQVDTILDKLLCELPTSDSDKLKSAMHHSITNGGKRIRALLCIASGNVFGASYQDLFKVASAIEMVHAYSLVHDDLPAMDDDDLRRGKPTCHVAFDEATAILAGDALQTLAFETLSEDSFDMTAQQQLQVIAELSKAAGASGMCLGQSLDLESEGKKIPYNALKNIHKYKTGALITASVLCGAIAGKASHQNLLQLRQFGNAIGLAFQIKDDILDIESTTEQLGKPQGSDTAMDKATYPALLGLQESKDECAKLLQTACDCLATISGDTSQLRAIAELIIDREH